MNAKEYIAKGKDFQYKHNDAAMALDCFESAIILEPKNGEAYVNKANALRMLGRCDEALKATEVAYKINPNQIDLYFIKARILVSLYDKPYAERFYEQGAKMKGGRNDESYFCQAKAAQELGKTQEALTFFDKAMKYGITWNIATKNKIALLESLGQHDKIIETCDYAIKHDIAKLNAYISKGNAYVSLGKYTHAQQCYDDAIILNPNASYPYYHKGICLNLRGRYSEALSVFNRALEIDPESRDLIAHKQTTLSMMISKYVNDAFFYKHNGEFIVKYCEEFLQMQPENLKMLIYISDSLAKTSQWDESIKYFMRILEIDNSIIDAHIGIINALKNEGRFMDTHKYLRKNKELLGNLYDELSYEINRDDMPEDSASIVFEYLGIDNIQRALEPKLIGDMPHALEIVEN